MVDQLRVPTQLTVAGLWAMAVLCLAQAATTPILGDASFVVLLTLSVGLRVIGWVFTATVFIIWLYLARLNLEERGETGLRWNKAWTIGGWFVPIANLVIPMRVVAEVYARSVPGAARTWPTPKLVLAWWLAFVLSFIRYTVTTTDLETRTAVVHYSSTWNAINGLAGAVAAVLAVQIVTRVANWQSQWQPVTATS